mmetsp:Transcript_4872/g.11390  ORF Transcript_4872/g.11390 Transcript_4872/m.11390 type:complete len:107 (-) Transcript_4872:36-356(-)
MLDLVVPRTALCQVFRNKAKQSLLQRSNTCTNSVRKAKKATQAKAAASVASAEDLPTREVTSSETPVATDLALNQKISRKSIPFVTILAPPVFDALSGSTRGSHFF